jgi:imidazolonepropionase-like amidohydrolase
MADAGFSPMECICAATGSAAQALGLGHETGTIRPGLAADLIAVRGRPDQAIGALRQVDRVVQAGIPIA